MQKPLTVCNLCSGITWMTKEGLKKPNYWGSVTQASTCRIGNFRGEEAYTPFSSLLPMVHPNDIVWGGWDISSLNLAEAMERAQVRQKSCHNACACMQARAALSASAQKPSSRSCDGNAQERIDVTGPCALILGF